MLNIWNVLYGFWLFYLLPIPSLTIFDILAHWAIPLGLPNFPNKPEHTVFGGKGQISDSTLLTRINGRLAEKGWYGKLWGWDSIQLLYICSFMKPHPLDQEQGWFCQKVTAEKLANPADPSLPRHLWGQLLRWKLEINLSWKAHLKANPSQLILPIHGHLKVE